MAVRLAVAAFLAGLLALGSLAGAGVVAAMLVADTASDVYERCSNVSLATAPLPQNSFVLAADRSPSARSRRARTASRSR